MQQSNVPATVNIATALRRIRLGIFPRATKRKSERADFDIVMCKDRADWTTSAGISTLSIMTPHKPSERSETSHIKSWHLSCQDMLSSSFGQRLVQSCLATGTLEGGGLKKLFSLAI